MNELSIDCKVIHNHKVVLQLLSFVLSLATHQSPIYCLFVSTIPPSMQLTSCLYFRCKLFNVGIQLRNVGCSCSAENVNSSNIFLSIRICFIRSRPDITALQRHLQERFTDQNIFLATERDSVEGVQPISE